MTSPMGCDCNERTKVTLTLSRTPFALRHPGPRQRPCPCSYCTAMWDRDELWPEIGWSLLKMEVKRIRLRRVEGDRVDRAFGRHINRFLRSVRTSYITHSPALQCRSKDEITSHLYRTASQLSEISSSFGVAPSPIQRSLRSHLSLRSQQLHLLAALNPPLSRNLLRSMTSGDWW